MSELSELNTAIKELNELWQVCNDDDQCEALLNKRDALDALATKLADKIIRDGINELNQATSALNELTLAAVSAKEEIDKVSEKILKTANVISKATTAISKVGSLVTAL